MNFEGQTFSNGVIQYTIHEHLGILHRYDNREEPWTKEVNVVSWNNGEKKIDIRDWNLSHERMSRGITLTFDQAKELAEVLNRKFE